MLQDVHLDIRLSAARAWMRCTGAEGASHMAEQVKQSKEPIQMAQAAVLGALDWGRGGLGILESWLDGAQWPQTILQRIEEELRREGLLARPASTGVDVDDLSLSAPQAPGADIDDLSLSEAQAQGADLGPSKVQAQRADLSPSEPQGSEDVEWNAPEPNPGVDMLEAAQAEWALSAALMSGVGSFPRLQVLVESSRVPTKVRLEAFHHLFHTFGRRALDPWLRQLLGYELPVSLRQRAAEVALARPSYPFDGVAEMVTDRALSEDLRSQAYRRILAEPKAATRRQLDRWVLSAPLAVAERSMQDLFTSLRFMPKAQWEKMLLNLLEEHQDPAVQSSAARGLGRFGRSQDALDQLRRRASGLWTGGQLREAVQEALQCWATRARN